MSTASVTTGSSPTVPPVRRPRRRLLPVLIVALAVMGTVATVPLTSATAAGPGPIAVTPFGGANATLTRAPYVTDLTQTGADVNWATTSSTPGSLQWGLPSNSCTGHVTAVPSTLPNSYPAAGTPTSITAPEFNVVSGTNEYQSTVVLTGLTASTTYCYRPLGPGSVDLLGTNPSQDFTTLDTSGPSTPLTFDVVGDIGETLYSSSTAFPGNLNTDQAAIDSLIGTSGAKFVVTAGDIGYSGGTQANYGDLQNGGSEVSDIFGPSYWPETLGLPVFPGEGNHGQNTIGLRSWPTSNTAAATGGTYAYDSYPAPTQDGTNAGSYPDAWYAVSDGNVRIYVLDAAWADGSNVGTATGAACTAAGEAACPGYQVDHDEHWTSSSPEYKWLAADMAKYPNAVKMAVWHYPLRSDESSQDSDIYLQNSPSNPYQSTSLESLLSANGVKVVFNGHAHDYQRIAPSAAGQVTNYVTGGGGAILEPVSTGSSCTGFESTGSIYAIGWSPTSNTGTACGPGVPVPQSAAQVFNFLKVTVNGGTVTVTPINAAGQSFDVQSYTYAVSTTPSTVIDTPPPALTNATTAAVSFHSTGSGATFTCKLDTGTATACTSPVTYTGLSQGSHTLVVTASGGATPATATWTVDTTAPSVPTGLAASAVSSSQVNLSWLPSSDNTAVTGYDIYRNGTLLTTTSGTGTTYSDTSVAASKVYQYTVDARDGAGNVSQQSSPPVPVTTPSGPTGPTLVQTVGSSTTTVTFPAASTPGDLLVLSAGVYTGASKPITAVSDGKNVWTKVLAKSVSGQNSDGELWYAANAASVTSVTVTTGATTVALRLQEFSGVATTSPLDTSVGAAGDSTAAASGSVTPAAAGELAVGFIAGHSTTQAITVTSPGYIAQPLVATSSPSNVTVETGYQDLASTAAQSFAGSFGTTMYWADGIALFKSGAPPPPPGDFTLAATAATGSVGSPATSTISTAPSTGTPQTVGFTASGLPTGATYGFSPSSVTSGASSTMTITPSATTPAGTYTVTVTGTGTSATHSTTFSLTVDTAPSITSAASTGFISGTAGSFTVSATGNPTPSIGTSTSLPTGVTLVDNGNGTATLASTTATPAGSYPIAISATNGVGTAAAQSFVLTVGSAPSITSTASATFTTGTAGSFPVTATGFPTPSISTSTMLPTGLTLVDGGHGSATLASTAATPAGTYPIAISAANGVGPAFIQNFTLTVQAPPAFGSAASATFTFGTPGTFTVTATGGPTPSIGTSTSLPSGVTLVDNGNGTATLTSTAATPTGSYAIAMSAANGVGPAAIQNFTLTVQAPPAITSAASTTFTFGTSGTFTVTTTGFPVPSITATSLPTDVTFIDNGNGTATLTSAAATPAGSYTLGISAANGVGTKATQSFTLDVNPPAFSVSASPSSTTVTAGTSTAPTVSTTATATVSLSTSGLPSGVSVGYAPQLLAAGGSSTVTFSTATTTTPGQYPITITATAGSLQESTTFTLTVQAAVGGTPHLVQTASGTETASSTSLSGSFPTQTGTGDLLVLSASEYNGATNHITSVTDTAGNKWTLIGSYNVSGHNSNGEMWYAANTSPTLTVTVHNSAAAFESFEVQEFAGMAASPLDVATGTSNTSTAPSSGSVTSTATGELAVGFIAGHGNAEAISVTSPGYTTQAEQTTTGTITTVETGYQVLGAPGAQSFTGSFGTAMYWAAGIAIFKP